MLKTLALCVGAALMAMLATTFFRSTSDNPWHNFAPEELPDPAYPSVKVLHPRELDYSFRTGALIPVVLEVHLPPGMVLESDTEIKGDLRLIERNLTHTKVQKDGTRYRLELTLQALDFKEEWVAFVTLTARQGDQKPFAMKPAGIMVYGSKTYDGRKEKYAKDPFRQALPHSLQPTLLLLAAGVPGLLLCLHVLSRRAPSLPEPAAPPPAVPVDQFDEVAASLAAVSQGDRSREALAAVVKSVRRYFNLNTLTFEEVKRRGHKQDAVCSAILRICEERGIWGVAPMTNAEWLNLWGLAQQLNASHQQELAEARAKMPKPPGFVRRRVLALRRLVIKAWAPAAAVLRFAQRLVRG